MLSKTKKIIKRVAFFGDANAKKNDAHFLLAFNTAKLLAENGYIVVNGGGPGVMLASTMGAKAGNGRVEVVVLDPKRRPKNYEGMDEENTNLADKKYTTENYSNRLNGLVKLADAFVVFKGGTGTLSEVGLTWEMARFEYGSHEPLIFVGEEWKEIVKAMVRDLDFDKYEKSVYEVVDKPEEVLKLIKERKSQKIGFWKKMGEMIKNF